MTSDPMRPVIDHLTARIEELSPYTLGGVSFAADRFPQWADRALARVAVVIGDVDRIRYSAGILDSSEDMSTLFLEVVAITDDLIVHAAFTTSRDMLRPEGDVRAWPRAAVELVKIGEVLPPDPTQRFVEGQRGAAEATLILAGGAELQLPPRRGTRRVRDAALLGFLPTLLQRP